jgi:drug/metabolite transporter (DMT)-like permease
MASITIALAQFCFKVGALYTETTQSQTMLTRFFNPAIGLGVAIYIISFPLTLHSYKLCALSKIVPLLSLSMVWSAILAVIFLSEEVTIYRLTGATLIILGSLTIGSER